MSLGAGGSLAVGPRLTDRHDRDGGAGQNQQDHKDEKGIAFNAALTMRFRLMDFSAQRRETLLDFADSPDLIELPHLIQLVPD